MNALEHQLEQRARRSPESIVLEGPDSSLNISELVARLHEVALVLRAGGYQTVALYADNSPMWVIVDLACQIEGICTIPVPTFFSPEQIAHLLRSAGAELLICQSGFEADLPVDIQEDGATIGVLSSLHGFLLRGTVGAQVPPGTSKITFTSGSTGTPKGVCLSFEQCLQVAKSLAEATGLKQPRHLCVLPLPTLLENIGGIYAPLLVDGCSVVVPLEQLGIAGSSGIDAARFLAALHHYQPNTLILVPQLLTVLDVALSMGWKAPESLHFIAVGGARVAPSLLHRARARGLPVYEGYGLSECASVVSLNRPGCELVGTSGQVLPHVHVTEKEGQLRVSGNTFLGYLNQPDSWYPDHVDTGDIGEVDAEGFVTVKGRSKNLLISSFGRNISPEWIESELVGTGSIRQVAVVGDGRPYCTALVFPLDENCAGNEIQAAIDETNATLPDYARIGNWSPLPEAMTASNSMLTANGRPRRDKIEQKYSQIIESMYCENKETRAT